LSHDVVDVVYDAFDEDGGVGIARLLEEFGEGGFAAVFIFGGGDFFFGVDQVAGEVEQGFEEGDAVQLTCFVLFFESFEAFGEFAEKAGLKEGDVITKVNDDKIADADDLYAAIGKYKPGEKVKVVILRAGKEQTITAELQENKQVRAFTWNNKDFDFDDEDFEFRMAPPGPGMRGFRFEYDDKPRMGLEIQDTENGKGVKVLEVEEDEPAEKAGIKEGDIITAINGKAVNAVDEMKEAMKTVKKGDTVKLTATRAGKAITINVTIPKELKTTDL